MLTLAIQEIQREVTSFEASRYTRDLLPSSDRARFATTRWSLVLEAGGIRSASADQALATLCDTYWYPLYAYLRGRGHASDAAQDLTQAFFARLLEKHVLRHADPARGRFRSFLLTALKNFAANERARSMAGKRGGGETLSLDFERAEGRYLLEPPSDETPERVFDRRWALALLAQVMSRLQDQAAARGGSQQFEILKAYLTGDQPQLGYAEAAAQLELTVGAVKVAVHRLRRRFRDLLRDEIAGTVSSPDDIEDEIRHLWSAVSR